MSTKVRRQKHSLAWEAPPSDTDIVRSIADTKVVYRRYASLFFIAGCASDDNELITLEIIHRYVEQMDKYYGNVCELDIIFSFTKAYYILDELLLAGELQESSKKTVLRCIGQQDSLEDMEVSNVHLPFLRTHFSGFPLRNLISCLHQVCMPSAFDLCPPCDSARLSSVVLTDADLNPPPGRGRSDEDHVTQLRSIHKLLFVYTSLSCYNRKFSEPTWRRIASANMPNPKPRTRKKYKAH